MDMATNLTTSNSPPHEVEDFFGLFRIFSDGSIIRSLKQLSNVPVLDDGTVLWKDVLYEKTNNIHLRMYKPASPSTNAKLPVVYFIPGGGFCIKTQMLPEIINQCFRLASELQAVVISPDYRLAPEHRLPAALEDGYTAVKWLQDQALSENPDPWLNDVADFQHIFISGESAGATIAHHLVVRIGAGSKDLAPLKVRGYMLFDIFLGGTVRTKSEAEGPKDIILNLELIDKFWKYAVPVGDTADSPMVNPFGPSSPSLKSLELDPILIVGGGGDLLKDRIEEYATKLKEWGKNIKYVHYENIYHGFFTGKPYCEAWIDVMQIIKTIVTENSK